MRLFACITVIISLISTATANAHEFWISTLDYQINSGESIKAELRVGQKFGGSTFAFIPARFERFELVSGKVSVPVKGRIGDNPALNMVAPADGLWIVVHETSDSVLNYSKWEKFVNFVEHKDLTGVLELHKDRNLPEQGFRENYRRYAKSLVAVGDGVGRDQNVGLRTEIVAQLNPYSDDVSNGLPVQVLFEGTPRENVQVEVFEKNAGGEVTVFTVRTDDQGLVSVPVNAGSQYLLDSVTMLVGDSGDPLKDPVWRSLWASLTFAVPG